jgi:hypothetical protein
MRVNSFFGFFCQSLVIAREVQHHVPRQLVLHSFRLSADFFGAFPPNLGISPGSSHHRDSLLGHFTVAVAHFETMREMRTVLCLTPASRWIFQWAVPS